MSKDEFENTLGDTDFGTSLKDLSDGDLKEGYFDAFPDGNYERFSEGREDNPFSFDDRDHQKSHGRTNEHGFVQRPGWKGSVDRN